mmetsp:Transcript_1000/g.2977  ORF Transcript_1000/g.2977 Transcript_1000/m.2977 type:complete len:220 (+) Transcript_1000:2313-2972(+)
MSPDLGQNGRKADLPHDRALSSHVRPSQQREAFVPAKVEIIWHKPVAARWVGQGGSLEDALVRFNESWLAPSFRDQAQGTEDVDLGASLNRLLPSLVMLAETHHQSPQIFQKGLLDLLLSEGLPLQDFPELFGLVPSHRALAFPLGGQLPRARDISFLWDFHFGIFHPVNPLVHFSFLPVEIGTQFFLHLLHPLQTLGVRWKVPWRDLAIALCLGPVEF